MLRDVYIPSNFFNDIKNSFVVGDLIDKYYGSDLVDTFESQTRKHRFLSELKQINEPKIYDLFFDLLKGEPDY